MRKLTKDDMDMMIKHLIKQRDRLEPHVQKLIDEIVPVVQEYKDKAVEHYNTQTKPQIIKHKKVLLTLFYMYTMTSSYRLSQKRTEWKAKISKIVR